ncbi:MAG: GntR family transcriptional regulator [Pararhodobacter sp.]|nr:GntR family transcriptional regulator [Pararhodobacter sp.]
MNIVETRPTLSSPELVVEAIVSGVYSGRMVPGQRLVEADLTRNLGVSRGPVREALKRLAAEGLVTLNRHRGAYIRALSRSEVHDTLIVLEVLVGLVARLAAHNIDKGDNHAALQTQFAQLSAVRENSDFMALLKERRDYYDLLIRIAENAEVTRLMPLMQIHLLRLQFQSYLTHEHREKQFEDYAAITEAILAGNRNRADRLMQIHIRRTRILLTRLPEEAFAQS